MSSDPLLEVDELQLAFHTEEGTVEALEGVSFRLHEREMVGIIGESGCGKSVTARSILDLLDMRADIHGGAIRYRDQNLLEFSEKELQDVRGGEITMIFQEPGEALNPVFSVRRQLVEAIQANQSLNDEETAEERAIQLLDDVRIPAPEKVLDDYPHQLSGGQQQRVMIALALACEPKVLIADEPTTALDVTVQAQILKLLAELKNEYDMSVLLITHDLGVVAQTCDRVAVMYAGSVVEKAPVEQLFNQPRHPYTERLLESTPTLEVDSSEFLPTITGVVPDLVSPPSGCRFRTRCEKIIKPDVDGLSQAGWDRIVATKHLLQDGHPIDTPRERFDDLDLGAFRSNVERAIEEVEAGNTQAAIDVLADIEDRSPCAKQRPPEVRAGTSRTRCLLYGGEEE